METAILAIIAFVPMLVMLVVIHEWGHFFTARAFGVKVLEFGIGYPPRAFAFYTGRTHVLLDAGTQFVNIDNLDGRPSIQTGSTVRVHSTEETPTATWWRALSKLPRPAGPAANRRCTTWGGMNTCSTRARSRKSAPAPWWWRTWPTP